VAESDDTRLPSPRDLKARLEAERTGVPFILWRDGNGQQQILMLGSDLERVTVGRRANSDVALAWDTEVSRTHALLEPVGEEWTVVDDGLSTNGSFVNGNRVNGRHRLNDNDRLCFGKTHIVYRSATDALGSQSTARTGEGPLSVPITPTQRKILIALCRPVFEHASATPATSPQIAEEVHLTEESIKSHLRELYHRFGYGDLPQNEKRARLVSSVLNSGILAPRDF
jgi:pSer/pThr/pTyr-binding forkhead associated (FHA) protein